ncbi:permease prefix domain 1-containing protein [Planomonospora corallina]|uniref:Permease prefix domain 1-containing protein n=1 Tax=Planomonospora corallina TaxID=1806052 RepID=A0ABV8I7J9_9ACTN
MGAGVIDDYVAGLGRALRGPRGPRLDLVTEARDSLLDAAEALEGGGLERAEAERRAVEEFGALDEIVPGYQEELTACAGRRLAVLLFLAVPFTAVMWTLMWRLFPAAPVSAPDWPGWFAPVARAVDLLQIAIGALGALALFALGRGRRRIRRPHLVARALALTVWGLFPVMVVLCGALMYGSSDSAGLSGHPPGLVASAVSYTLWGLQLYCAGRCLALTRRRSVPA